MADQHTLGQFFTTRRIDRDVTSRHITWLRIG